MAPAALTEKQAQVYALLKDDTDPKDIAEALGVSKAAIYSHIRAVKEAGHPIPAKYANVGTGAGRGKARGTSRAASKPAATGTRGRGRGRSAGKAPTAVVPPTPTTPAPTTASDAPVSPEQAFAALAETIQQDRSRFQDRRTAIASEIETLEAQIGALRDEDGDLEVALARLTATERAIEGATGDGAANGAAKVSLSGAAA